MHSATTNHWEAFYGSHLQGFRKLNDKQAQAQCPFHEDNKPSFSINIVEGLWNCHGGCGGGNAIEFVDKKSIRRETIPGWELRQEPKTIKTAYDYKDEKGNLLFQAVRYEPKSFRQRRPYGAGGWKWDLNGTRRVLYRLPELIVAKEQVATVIIVEGERDVETLLGHGFIVTCNPMGAGKWLDEYAESLKGFLEVIIIADKDKVGWEHAQQIAVSVSKVVERVKVLELPGDGVKDATDYFEAGGTPKGLMDLVQAAPLWTPSTESFHVSTPIEGKQETIRMEAVPLVDFMASGDAEITWRIEGILPTEGVAILGGNPGHGKSWTLLDLAIEVACGGQWLDHFTTTKGPVLYVDEESSDRLLRKRLSKLLLAKGLQPQDVEIKFIVGRGLCLTTPKSVGEFRRILQEERPALVIIDALIRVFKGDENSSTDMASVFAPVKSIVRDFQCAIIFADHQRKIPPAFTGIPGDQLLRGSSEKLAFVDSLLTLSKRDDVLSVEHSKSRYAEPVPSFAFRIQDNPEKTETRVEYIGEAEPLKKVARLKSAYQLLEQLYADDFSGYYRKELVGHAGEAGISQKNLDEALKSWVSEGRLEAEKRKEGQGAPKSYYQKKTLLAPSNELFQVSTPIDDGEKETIPQEPVTRCSADGNGHGPALDPNVTKAIQAFGGQVRP